MTVTATDNRYSNFLIFLLISFPILIISVKPFGNLILLVLLFLGSYIFIKQKKNPFLIPELKTLSWITLSYFLVMMASMIIADGLAAQFHHLGRKIHFLLAPLIALAIYDNNLSIVQFLRSIKFGLILIGIIVLVQFFIWGYDRPSGMFNENVFSDLAVILLFLSIVRFFEETKREQIFTSIAAIFGVIAVVLSASRGSWLSFLVLIPVYFGIASSRFSKGNYKRSFGLIILTIVISIGFTQIDLVKEKTAFAKKIGTAIDNAQSWSNDKSEFTSTSARLEMWKYGLLAAEDSPLFGHGYRNANEVVSNYAMQFKKEISMFTHLHNEYLTNLVSAGLVGLVSMIILLFAPLIVFVKKLRSEEHYNYALMGVLLCVAYSTFGFTHIALGEENMNAFYVFFLSLLLPKMRQKISV